MAEAEKPKQSRQTKLKFKSMKTKISKATKEVDIEGSKMKAYQLSKINGYYWWTGSAILTQLPEENDEYKWTYDLNIVKQLSGRKI